MKFLWFHLMPYTRLPEDFTERLSMRVQVRSIEGAGHLLELDAPMAAADAVARFID